MTNTQQRDPVITVVLAFVGGAAGVVVGAVWLWQFLSGEAGVARMPIIVFAVPAVVLFFVGGVIGFPIDMLVNKVREHSDDRRSQPAHGPTQASVADELRKLSELHDTGVLSDSEFAAAKRRLIG